MILSYDMILENLQRTNRQTDKQTDRQTENSKPEATLIPVDRRGERANRQRIQLQRPLLSPVDRRGERANIHFCWSCNITAGILFLSYNVLDFTI